MPFPFRYHPQGLTPSQWRNLAALVAGGLLTLNEHWPQIVAVVGLHYHGLPIPPGITLVLQITAFAVTSLSRALNRAKSGTGTGIVGNPADAPVLAPAVNDTRNAGGTLLRASSGDYRASSGDYAGLTPTDVSGFVAGLAAALAAYQVPPLPPVVVTTPPPPRPINVTITADSPLDAAVIQAAHAALDAQALDAQAIPAPGNTPAPADTLGAVQTATAGAADPVNVIVAPPPALVVAPPALVGAATAPAIA